MYDFPARKGPVTPRAIALSVAAHVLLFGSLWLIGVVTFRPKEEVIPIDMTVVPPWAVQTDDPEPDPNPPPKVETPKPRPKPEPVVEKTPEPKVEAVEKIVEKPKPEKPKPPEKIDLRKEAKFVKTPVEQPKPVDLRAQATKVEPPPMVKTTGKGTAADKPISREEFDRLMNQGYRIGPRNQLTPGEEQRCKSIIVRVVKEECMKKDYKWHEGLRMPVIGLSFGPGGRITRFRLAESCGDDVIDRYIQNAISRIGSIPGLTSSFLEKYRTNPFLVGFELLQR